MKKIPKAAALSLIMCSFISGCTDMPTPPSQITASHNSGTQYKNYDCPCLEVELDSLTTQEDELVVAQQQRIEASKEQKHWWGVGLKDGTEASELADVRGQKEAVRREMEAKGCPPYQAESKKLIGYKIINGEVQPLCE